MSEDDAFTSNGKRLRSSAITGLMNLDFLGTGAGTPERGQISAPIRAFRSLVPKDCMGGEQSSSLCPKADLGMGTSQPLNWVHVISEAGNR